MARTKKTAPEAEVKVEETVVAEAVASEEITTPKFNVMDFMPKGPKRFYPAYPGSKTPCPHWLDLVSIDSPEHFEVQKEHIKNPPSKDEDQTDAFYRTWWESVASCVVGWDETFYGEYSKANVRKLFQNHGFNWCREQVQAYINDITNFI